MSTAVPPSPASPLRLSRAVVALLVVVTSTVACSGTVGVPMSSATPRTSASIEPTTPGATSIATATTIALTIETAPGAKDFHYAQAALTAPAGSTITLKLVNTTNPDDEIGHNWVLVKPGQEDAVLASGAKAGDDGDWLDPHDPGIVAATKLIEGNADDSVTFTAPEPGTYPFLCTFPDHYAGGMKGTLTIG